MTTDRRAAQPGDAAVWRRIAVVAHKGGVGKTTVTVNLGGALAAMGRRVLLVDCDPQGSLSEALGLSVAPPALMDVLAEEAPAAAAVRPTAVERLAVLPANQDLTNVEDRLYGRAGWHQALRRALGPLAEYDVVLLDTPPGLGVLSLLGIVAADAALVLCPPEYLAQRALGNVLATLERARRITPGIALAGILPTLVGGRSRHQQTVLAELAAEYGERLLPPIPRRAVLQDAARAGLPVSVYAPRSDAAEAFAGLASILLGVASRGKGEPDHPDEPGPAGKTRRGKLP
jgi:chromosome partitioning protein